MSREPNEIEQALSKTIRSSLDRFQRTAEELHHAVNDLVAACSSARVANTLPPMMRAQMSAASLAASLEALSRFVALNLPPTLAPALAAEPPAGWAKSEALVEPSSEAAVAPAESPAEPRIAPSVAPLAEAPPIPAPSVIALIAEARTEAPVEPAAEPTTAENRQAAEPPVEAPGNVFAETPEMEPNTWASAAAEEATEKPPEFSPEAPEAQPETVASLPASELLLEQEIAAPEPEPELAGSVEFTDFESVAGAVRLSEDAFPEGAESFDIAILPAEMQELHRRANRVAKVSMQDIKLLRPEDVRLGQEHRDLCYRLRDDLERAHKEYDRRFQTILGHPVDYFYDWLVEILAEGDPQLLGEYPYPSAALRR